MTTKPKSVRLDHCMTTAEAGEQLGLKTDTIKKYCQSGKIKAVSFGSVWIIHRRDVARFQKTLKNAKG